MGKIKLLDNSTINKIAAGEVVERPVSIVKELIENSIDALSTNIIIEIKKGGKSYIRVTDNGVGIEKDDLERAFLRHSTSKIDKVEDLQNIMTLGFRGEALSSISAVSQLEVISKVRSNDTGSKLEIFGSEIREKSEVGSSNGTTIIVKNLFYNIPVRKKFLKTDSAESMAITDLISKLSIGNPNISFKYIKDKSIVLKTSGNGQRKDTIYVSMGSEFIEKSKYIESKNKDIDIKGYISTANYYRGNRGYQYIYVNGRLVKNLELSKKIEGYYENIIPSNRYPAFILYIETDPLFLDVNIHPSKTEIRFSNKEDIIKLLKKLFLEKLNESEEILEVNTDKTEEDKKPMELELSIEDYLNQKNVKEDIVRKPSFTGKKHKEYKNFEVNKKSSKNKIQKNEQVYDENNKSKNDSIAKEYVEEIRESINPKLPELRVLGIAFKTYILCEDTTNREIYIIDQHAAHERILYEKYREDFMSRKVYVQKSIFSEKINFSIKDMEKIKINKDNLTKLGFEFEEFGGSEIILRGVPHIFGNVNFKNLFMDIIDKLNIDIKNAYELIMEKIIKTACVAAVKAGDKANILEMEGLIESLSKCRNPYTCPHGRPTILKYTEKELRKSFKRT